MMQDPNAAAAIAKLNERLDTQGKLLIQCAAGIGIIMDRLCWDDLGRQFAEQVMPLMEAIKKAQQPSEG